MIDAFAAHLPVRIRFGEGVAEQIPELIGGRRALAIVEQPVAGIPAVAAATAGVEVLAKPPGEPTFELITTTEERVRELAPKVIVAVGGDRRSIWQRPRGWWRDRASRSAGSSPARSRCCRRRWS